ncbi:dihydrodipicolinate synthase family protein [Micromonospora sp. NPDC047670]|uniref:dihydrodipicolinate synthase family protein n=1 Tax=Micromonospora sp. NPDC047670 TaxID=3364252 RepID=UPI0037153AC8
MLLPLHADDTIAWDRLAHALDVLVGAGLDGVYAHGTAGEFHTLGEEEYDRINELVADRCGRHRIPFQIGASHMSAQTCLGRVHRARAFAPSGSGAHRTPGGRHFPTTAVGQRTVSSGSLSPSRPPIGRFRSWIRASSVAERARR